MLRATGMASATMTAPAAPPLVLFASLGNVGQLNPLLAIAECFAKQHSGVRTVLATSRERERAVRAAGLEFLAIWDSCELSEETCRRFNDAGIRNVDAMVYNCTELLRSEANYRLPAARLEAWVAEHRPWLMVCDTLTEAALTVALRAQVPFIVNTPLPPYFNFPECLPKIFPPFGSGTSLVKTSWWHRLYDLAVVVRYGYALVTKLKPIIDQDSAAGVPAPDAYGAGAVAFFNNTSPLLADPRVAWPDKVQWIGTVLSETSARLVQPKHFAEAWARAGDDPANQPLHTWMETAQSSGSPIVVVSLGSIYRLDAPRVQAIYDALRPLPVHVLWKLSASEQAHLPPDARTNDRFWVLEWFTDPMLVLAHPSVKLHINHGGANTLHEALYFGKPQVCLPAWLDCFDFAMRLQDAGAGRSIDTAPHLDATQLLVAAKEVLFDNPSYVERAARLADDLRARGGAAAAAALVAETLQVRRSTL